MKINKQVKLALLLCFITIVTFAQTAQRGEQDPPIPGVGVVVKRNPGGGASKAVVTNEKGQANITIKEAGNYTIALTQTQGKTAGEPIGGIVVKCGSNLRGKMMSVTTNEKGEADLNDLEKGDYTFTVEQPDASQATTDYVGHVTLIKKNGEKPNTNMTISDGNTSTNYVGHVTLLKFSQLYIGSGLQMPSSTTKDGANSVNGIDFNIGYYQPIWAWEKSMISLGINAELGYNLGNGERDTKNQYAVYNLAGQSQLPTVSERGDKKPGQELGFRGAAGLQLNVHLGDKFTLSPIVNAGYLSMTNKSFSVEETIYPQGNEFTYALLEQKESKTSGLGILPKLRMTYNITPRIGIWLEGNYTIGPKIKTEVTTFAPEPSAGVDGTYTLSQFENGAYTTSKRETSYSAVGVNGGVVFSLGKGNGNARPGKFGHCPRCNYSFSSEKEVYSHTCLGTIYGDYYDHMSGAFNYFTYAEDFTIENEELTSVLGVNSFTIKKGLYNVDRKNSKQGGTIVLDLLNPIIVNKKMIIDGKRFEGSSPKNSNCDGPGNTCFYYKGSNDKKDLQPFTMTPIIDGEFITKIKIQYERSKNPGNAPGF